MQTIRTPENERKFLAALQEFEGNVSRAAMSAGLARTALYQWRNEVTEFREKWDDIVEAETEKLEDEARRRAYDGWLEPVFYQGEQVGEVRRFSDVLLMFTLKARKPEKYRDNSKVEVGGPNSGPIQVNVVYETPK